MHEFLLPRRRENAEATRRYFATKTPRHKVPLRMFFNSVVDSYFAKDLSIFIHERMIILFPKYHFYILHCIFYILHFHSHECTNFFYRGVFCHEGAKAQSFRNRFHAKLAKRLRREGFVFISPFGGLRGLTFFYSLFLLSYYLFQSV